MFADILRSLIDPAPAPLADSDARWALCAGSDGDYAAIEMTRIDGILAAYYGLADPTNLRTECEALEKRAPDTARFPTQSKTLCPTTIAAL